MKEIFNPGGRWQNFESVSFLASISRVHFTRSFHGNKLFLCTKIPLLGNTLQFYPEYVANYNVICSPVLLPRLVVMATINNQSQDDTRRREIALELMEAYVSLTCCCILFITLEKLLLEFFGRLVPSFRHVFWVIIWSWSRVHNFILFLCICQ